MTLLIDAAPIVALADPNEPDRESILATLRDEPGDLVMPATTTAEVDYLLGQRFGQAARRAFLNDVSHGRFNVACLEREDYNTIIDLDTRYADLRSPTPPTFYLAYQQSHPSRAIVQIRTAADPTGVLAEARAAVASLDHDLPLTDVRTMREQVDSTLTSERTFARLTSGFGLLALLLACIGIYGIMAYTVARRTGEIGIRMALGAPRASVLWMVMRDVAGMLGVGLALGIALSLALTRFIAAQLYGVQATDIWTYVAAMALMCGVALVSGFLPARRASAIDPLATLRYE